jgi:hypothetical protein
MYFIVSRSKLIPLSGNRVSIENLGIIEPYTETPRKNLEIICGLVERYKLEIFELMAKLIAFSPQKMITTPKIPTIPFTPSKEKPEPREFQPFHSSSREKLEP